jgi:hypothetical protein
MANYNERAARTMIADSLTVSLIVESARRRGVYSGSCSCPANPSALGKTSIIGTGADVDAIIAECGGFDKIWPVDATDAPRTNF